MIGADAARHLDQLAKPIGSLGRLEELAVRLAETQRRIEPLTRPRTLIIFAGDHGVVAEGVSLWSPRLTKAIMRLTLEGRSAGAALARSSDANLLLVDVGCSGEPLEPHAAYRTWRVGNGTANLASGPAMSEVQFDEALAVGARAARECIEGGARMLALGEIGIGNSTAAACLSALLTDVPSSALVGSGAGATAESLARKQAVVEASVARVRATLELQPRRAMAALGGFEIVAIAGCIIEASKSDTTIILDGFITVAGALVAQTLHPSSLRTVIAAHLGAEPGHAILLDRLRLDPLLDWKLRLGEGTGALLALPMLDAAASLLCDVSKLDDIKSE